MKKILYSDYLRMIVTAVSLKQEDAIELFYTSYMDSKGQNSDFIFQLARVINEYINEIKKTPTICFQETEAGIKRLGDIEIAGVMMNEFNSIHFGISNQTKVIRLTKEKIEYVDDAFKEFKKKVNEEKESEDNKEEQQTKEDNLTSTEGINPKLVMLFLCKRIGNNKTKIITTVKEKIKKFENGKWRDYEVTTLNNYYGLLQRYIDAEGTDPLNPGQIRTWDNFRDQLTNPLIQEKLKQLNLV